MTGAETLDVEVVRERVISGLAGHYRDIEGLPQFGEPEALARELADRAEANDLVPSGARGGDIFQWIADRLRGRVLQEDLGVHRAEFDWLVLHVPPGGTADLEVETAQTSKFGVALKLLGLGFGSGREIEFSLTRRFDNRSVCTRFTQVADVRVRRYTTGSGDSADLETVTDVEQLRERRVVPLENCPHCGLATSDLDPFDYEVSSEGIDLRLDQEGASQTEKRELRGQTNRQISNPLAIAGLTDALQIGVKMDVATALRCEVTWNFPGGRFFTPYWRLGESATLPFWSVGQ